MRRCHQAGLVLCLLLLAGCTATPRSYSDFDPGTDFSGYRSFSWISASPLYVDSPNPVSPALEGVLMQEVRAYLTSRGFTYRDQAADADFVIAFTLGSQVGVQTANYPGRYGDANIVGEDWQPETGTQDYTEVSLAIDIFDRASAQKKWMGWSEQELTMTDRLHQQSLAREAVRRILAHFPPDA